MAEAGATVVDEGLRVRDYSVSYATGRGPLQVLEGVDLAVRPGEVLGLVGESGSGKSTLAYAVMRTLRAPVAAESGDIALGGVPLRGLDEHRLSSIRGNRIAMVFQHPGASLNPTLTLGEHFRQVLARHRDVAPGDMARETERLLAMVGLPDPTLMARKYPHEVSGGENQRAVIALAFACEPELILFDEATSALDATTAANILDLFRDLQRESGVAALFISHDLGVVSEIAHRVAVIYAGRIVEVAPVADLFSAPRHPYTRALLASLPRPSLAGRGLAAIPGALPDRIRPIAGCHFADRCTMAIDACREGAIPLQGREGHLVACLRQGDPAAGDAPQITPPASDAPTPARPERLSASTLTVRIERFDLLARLLGRPPDAVHAVDRIDLTLGAGETLGLVGESGCGKSSLARALTGLRDFEGEIRIGERTARSPADMDREYRRRIQVVFQNPDHSLNPRHTIGTILARPLRLYRGLSGSSLRGRIADLLERVQLPRHFAERYPHELSGGEKQRVAIARALGAEPEIIVCDEITSGLDASVQAAVVNLLRDIRSATGVSLLFITHDLNLLRHVADRVAVMYLGRIVEIRDAARLAEPPYHPYTEALLSSAPALEAGLDVRRVRLAGVIPSRIGKLDGCPFESRCPRRIGAICRQAPPPEVRAGEGHVIACHLDAAVLEHVPPIWRIKDDASIRFRRDGGSIAASEDTVDEGGTSK